MRGEELLEEVGGSSAAVLLCLAAAAVSHKWSLLEYPGFS